MQILPPTMRKPSGVADLGEDPVQRSQRKLFGSWGLGSLDKLPSPPSFHTLGLEKEISEGPLVLMSSHLCGVPNSLPSPGQ